MISLEEPIVTVIHISVATNCNICCLIIWRRKE